MLKLENSFLESIRSEKSKIGKRVKFICPLLLSFFISISSSAQFNTIYGEENHFTSLTSVFCEDSITYATGVYVDSFENFSLGSVFYRLNSDGIVLNTISKVEEGKTFEVWENSLLKSGNRIFNVGSLKSPFLRGSLFYADDSWTTINHTEFESPVVNTVKENTLHDVLKDGNDFWILMNGKTINDKLLSIIAKIDTSFSIQFFFELSSSYHLAPGKFLFSNDGNLVVINHIFNIARRGQRLGLMVSKVSKDGQILQQFTSPINEQWGKPTDIKETASGDFIISTKFGEETIAPNGLDGYVRYQPAIVCLDSNLNFKWEFILNGASSSYNNGFSAIAEGPSEDVFFAVGQRLFSYPERNSWDQKGVIFAFGPEGDSLWTIDLQYISEDKVTHEINDIAQSSDGGYFLCGRVFDERDSINREKPFSKGWILKVDSFGCLIPGCQNIAGVSETKFQNHEIELFPNPSDELLYFKLKNTPLNLEPYRVDIYNVEGKRLLIKENLIEGEFYSLDLSKINNGIYYFITTRNGVLLGRQQFLKN